MKNIFLVHIICIFLLTSCGFKVINQNLIQNFDIAEIETNGNSRINYFIKNRLLLESKNSEKKLVKLKLNTKKEKIIKERNIKNEITKYQLNIIAEVNLYLIAEDKSLQFKVSESGEFSVKSIHSKTIFNEKKTLKILSENISDKIIEEITIKLNDL